MRFLPEDGHSQKAVKLDETCPAEAHAPVDAMLELAYALSPVLRKFSGEEILSLVNTTPTPDICSVHILAQALNQYRRGR